MKASQATKAFLDYHKMTLLSDDGKSFLRNSWRLHVAIGPRLLFSPIFGSLTLYYVRILFRHVTLEAKHIPTNGSSTAGSEP